MRRQQCRLHRCRHGLRVARRPACRLFLLAARRQLLRRFFQGLLQQAAHLATHGLVWRRHCHGGCHLCFGHRRRRRRRRRRRHATALAAPKRADGLSAVARAERLASALAAGFGWHTVGLLAPLAAGLSLHCPRVLSRTGPLRLLLWPRWRRRRSLWLLRCLLLLLRTRLLLDARLLLRLLRLLGRLPASLLVLLAGLRLWLLFPPLHLQLPVRLLLL